MRDLDGDARGAERVEQGSGVPHRHAEPGGEQRRGNQWRRREDAGKTQRCIVSAWIGTAFAQAVGEPWPKAA
jgi:hypothetical protein